MMVRIAVSSCLVGEPVRWDGGDKLDPGVLALRKVGELVPFCPEVALGLGVPRPPIDLIDDGEGVLALRGEAGDHTAAMRALGRERAAALIDAGISGYVLKSRSPSCGLRDVPVIRGGERVDAGEIGMFAATIAAELPGLPLADELELDAPAARASFVTRVRAWSRTAAVFGFGLERPWRRRELVAHHSAEKLMVMAHAPERYRQLGSLVAAVASREPGELAAEYREQLLAALAEPPSRGRHVNALQHIAGYLDGDERRRANQHIAAFAAGEISLDDARAALLDAARRSGHDYLAAQTYLTEPGLA